MQRDMFRNGDGGVTRVRPLASFRRAMEWFTGVSCPVCLFAVIIAVAMTSISVGAVVLDRLRAQQQASMMAKGVADIARQRTSDLFGRIDTAMRAVEDAASPALLADGARARVDAAISQRRRNEPRLLALYVLDRAGTVLSGSASTGLRSNTIVPACLSNDHPDADQVTLRPFSIEQSGSAPLRGLCIARGLRQDANTFSVLAVVAGDLVQGQFADLSVGSHGAVVLLDEAGRPMMRMISGQPIAVERNDPLLPIDWEVALRGSGTDPATGIIIESRRIDGPFGAIVAIVIPPQDIFAAWAARAQLIGSSAFVVMMFIGLAVAAVRTCESRERRRLDRVAALTLDLRRGEDPQGVTRRLIEEACTFTGCEVVPPSGDTAGLETDGARLPELILARPDRVRIGGHELRRRDGRAFSQADLTYLTVLARIAALQFGQADSLAKADAATVALREVAESARHATDAILLEMPEATFTLDREWRFMTTNRNADKLFGEYAEDIRGRAIWDVFPELEGTLFETECRRAREDRHPVEFEMKWLRTETWLMVNAHPRPNGIAVYLQDISRQVAIDDKLRQTVKMEAIGTLTGGIAHDFNNLLTVIIGNIEMLDTELPPSGEAREMHDQIKRAAQKAAETTQHLLAFARRQPLSPSDVDVGRLVIGLDGWLRSAIGPSVSVEIHTSPSLWHARIDPHQLENAILNLAINARDAIPQGRGGKLKIEATNLANRKPETDQFGELRPGNYVVVSVTDNGTGIPKDIIGKVFDPYFTTKPSGRGTGLGLANVHGFVLQSGGHARIVSDEGRGTTIRLYLPAIGDTRTEAHVHAQTAARPPAETPDPVGRSEKILVVEDTELVRTHAEAVLTGLGYDVVVAVDGVEALAKIDGGLRPDLLLTDILLPNGMDGLAVAELVQRRVPGIPVLYMSGYVENIDLQKSRLDPQTNLLLKPFRKASLAMMVRSRLDSVRA